MKIVLRAILTMILMFTGFASFAQAKTVTGTITDQAGQPLPGVNVLVKGTTAGTQTDFDGNYSIEAEEGGTLVFSYIGQKTQESVIGATDIIDIQMEEDAAQLEEVVVVGYGTQSKRTLTDNIAKLTSEDIAEVPNPNLQNSIVAKAAGVQVTQTNGKVEGGINIRVRGAASVSGGTQPLYVLDGIPLFDPVGNNTDVGNDSPTNPLLTLSANEIESIDILKDASSAAIYGARGANGVVLITTKRGKQGKAKFSLNLAQGFSQPTNKREWLNTNEYIELFTEAAINGLGEEDGIAEAEGTFDFLAGDTSWRLRQVDTDWTELAFQDGFQTDADFSISGADEKTSYYFSGAYNNTDGIIRSNELERVNARTNLSHNFSEKFTASMNLSISRTEIDRIANDNAFATPLQAIAQSPLSLAYLPDGSPNPNTLYGNFLLDDENAFFKTLIRRVTGKVSGEYRFIPSLKFNSDFSYDNFAQSEDNYRGQNALFQSTSGQAFATNLNSESYVFSNFLTFDKLFADKHNVNVVLGTEYTQNDRRIISVTSQQFPGDDLPTVSGGAEVTAGTGVEQKNTFAAYFARATYSFNDKYLLKASIRRDGSSRFGENVRFGNFPSISGGWIISEENFLKNSNTLSFLKLRASYGELGNAEIGNFASRFLFSAVAYNQRPGLAPFQPGNPNLTWETTKQTDIGLDYGFLDGKISGEIDYYVKNTEGLLFEVPLVPSSGSNIINRNIGALRGEGYEFVLNTRNITTDKFTWTTNFNISNNTTELQSLPNDNADIVTGENINRVGETLASFYLREYAGVDPTNGDALYYLNTENADGTLNREETTNDPNEAQRIAVGNPYPEWYGGLTNSISYNGIDFSFTFQGEWGASIYNGGGRFQSASADFYDNQSVDQLQRWQQPGDITDVPQARLFGGNGTAASTRYLDESDFIRLRNLTLGYTIPSQTTEKIGFSKLRLYFTGVNLLTFTDYKFEDPEARNDNAADSNPGTTFYSSPPAKTFTIGLNINF